LALIASSLRSTSKKPVCPMTRSLHPPMAHCGQRVRFAATWREEFFEVPLKLSELQTGNVLSHPRSHPRHGSPATFAVRRRCDYGGSEGKTPIEAAPLPIAATIALEMIGPIPGTVINHWQLSSARAKLIRHPCDPTPEIILHRPLSPVVRLAASPLRVRSTLRTRQPSPLR